MDTTDGRRGPYSGTARRREQIVAAAFDAFSLSGFRGSSVKEISEAVGMSRAGLLHHFASKEELLLEVLRMREQMNEAPSDATGLAFFGFLRNTIRVDGATPGAVALFATMSAEATDPRHPAHTFFVERYRHTIDNFTRGFQQARDDGDLSEDLNPEEEARALIAVLDGLQIQMLLDPNLDRVAAVERYLTKLLDRYSTTSPEPLRVEDLPTPHGISSPSERSVDDRT